MSNLNELIPSPAIRSMCAADLDAVMRLQAQAYGDALLEPMTILQARLACAPQTAWVAERDGVLQAYLFGYRSRLGRVTALHAPFHPEAQGDCLYLHDLAVAPAAAGQGLGPRLVAQAWQVAQQLGCAWSALVSVQDSRGFWRRLGYVAQVVREPAMRQALGSYGVPADYMIRPQSSAR